MICPSLNVDDLHQGGDNKLTMVNILTFPPDAHREPSGDTPTVDTNAVCPKWFVFSLQLVKFHTYNIDMYIIYIKYS